MAKAFVGSLVGTELEASETETTLSQAERAFNRFVSSYNACKSYGSGSCVCDQFDFSTLPEGYSIKLEDLSGEKTRIEFYSNKPTPDKADVIENADLCFYHYDKSKGTFSKNDVKQILLDADGIYDYKIDNIVQMFKFDDKSICLISGTYESKEFDEITRLQPKCSIKASTIEVKRAGILDLGDYSDDYPKYPDVPNNPQIKNEDSSSIIEELRTLLVDNIGKITRITGTIGTTQMRLERRQNMFSEAYNNYDIDKDGKKDGLISDNVYFISIRSIQIQKDDSAIKKDYFKIYYLQGSEQSKILAEKIASRMQQLNGKLMVDYEELSKSEANENFRFDFQLIYEENTKDNVGPVFLTCTESYTNFIACKESVKIPAVFIDVVEVVGDGHNLLERHHKPVAGKVYEGVSDYIAK